MVNRVPFLQKKSRTPHVDHVVTKVISFYLFEARHFQPLSFGSLSSHFPWGAFLYGTWSAALNCTSSFSDCRFPGKQNRLHFSAHEEGCKEARQNELTLPVDRRNHEETTVELGIIHVSCCIPFCVLHLQRQTILLRITKLFLKWRSQTHLKKICALPKSKLERKGFISSSGCGANTGCEQWHCRSGTACFLLLEIYTDQSPLHQHHPTLDPEVIPFSLQFCCLVQFKTGRKE